MKTVTLWGGPMHGQLFQVDDHVKEFALPWASPYPVGSFDTLTTTTTGSYLRYAGYAETKAYVGSYQVFEYGEVQ